MDAEGRKDASPSGSLVWERPEPPSRTTLEPLSRATIVEAALGLSEREGITAVSLRNIARELGFGPMRLYGYIDSKDELIDLLIDEVYGRLLRDPLPEGGWREVLSELARRLRRAAVTWPWFTAMLSGRPALGPHALLYTETALSALTGRSGLMDIDRAVLALSVLHAYVVGAAQTEQNDVRAARETGMDEETWRLRVWPYLERALATGRYPTLGRVVTEHEHLTMDERFERGLHCTLDGIAAHLGKGLG